MKALNQGYEGNTQFCDEEIDENRFYVERVYLDSPREDCNGYYSHVYGFATAKEAYKAAMRWNKSQEPEEAYCYLQSGKPRRFNIVVNDQIVASTYSYSEFQKKLSDWRNINLMARHSDVKLNYQIKFV